MADGILGPRGLKRVSETGHFGHFRGSFRLIPEFTTLFSARGRIRTRLLHGSDPDPADPDSTKVFPDPVLRPV